MRRRAFLQSAIYSVLLTPITRKLYGRMTSTPLQFDRFGGWTGKKFEATGFFRVEKEERWWLVTPEGNAFLSFGINHLHPNWWKQTYNRDAWQNKLGVTSVEEPAFGASLRSWFLQTCREIGFNTVGVHNDLSIINAPQPAIPYMRPIRFLDVAHWRTDVTAEHFKDVFSPEFERHCDRLAAELAAPLKDDPFLLGYAMTDCPLFTEEDCRARTDVIGGARRESRIGWPRRLRNLEGDAPGKQAYVASMREIYGDDIHAFNKTYDTNFNSFNELAGTRLWRPQTDLSNANETRDNTRFLQHVVERYYQTASQAIRRYDANHLFFGDKMNGNTDSLDTLLPIIARFVDVIFYQMYGRYEVQKPRLDRWSKRVDRPIINGDAAFTMITPTMPRPYGPIADNLDQRAEWTVAFFQNAFSRPEFVGWHYCGLIDASNQIPAKEGRQHSGLLDGFGKPYPVLSDVLKEQVEQLYKIAVRQ